MKLGKIFAGMGMLIAIYLFVKNPDSTAKIISSGTNGLTQGVKAFQGR